MNGALVVLRYRNGLDYRELAMAFGLKEGTIRMRVSRALSKMRRALEAASDESPMRLEELAAPSFASMPEPRRRAAKLAPPPPMGALASPALGSVLRSMSGGPPAPSSPPTEHPLSAFFAATRQLFPAKLEARLLTRSRAL